MKNNTLTFKIFSIDMRFHLRFVLLPGFINNQYFHHEARLRQNSKTICTIYKSLAYCVIYNEKRL